MKPKPTPGNHHLYEIDEKAETSSKHSEDEVIPAAQSTAINVEKS